MICWVFILITLLVQKIYKHKYLALEKLFMHMPAGGIYYPTQVVSNGHVFTTKSTDMEIQAFADQNEWKAISTYLQAG